MEPQPPSEPLPPPPPKPLPIISEVIKKQLLEELSLDIDPKTRSILSNITGKPPEYPGQLVKSLTNTVFTDLIGSNREFVEVVDDELTKVEEFPYFSSERTKGMAIVLRAFDINSGFDLIPRFSNLQMEDLTLVKRIMQQNLPPKKADLPLLKRLLTMPRIPEQQIALNEVVGKIARIETSATDYILEGATAMYQILGQLWPKLYPQNHTGPPEPLPPDAL